MNDDNSLDAIEAGLVPSPEIDLSEPTEETDVTEEVAKAMDK